MFHPKEISFFHFSSRWMLATWFIQEKSSYNYKRFNHTPPWTGNFCFLFIFFSGGESQLAFPNILVMVNSIFSALKWPLKIQYTHEFLLDCQLGILT